MSQSLSQTSNLDAPNHLDDEDEDEEDESEDEDDEEDKEEDIVQRHGQPRSLKESVTERGEHLETNKLRQMLLRQSATIPEERASISEGERAERPQSSASFSAGGRPYSKSAAEAPLVKVKDDRVALRGHYDAVEQELFGAETQNTQGPVPMVTDVYRRFDSDDDEPFSPSQQLSPRPNVRSTTPGGGRLKDERANLRGHYGDVEKEIFGDEAPNDSSDGTNIASGSAHANAGVGAVSTAFKPGRQDVVSPISPMALKMKDQRSGLRGHYDDMERELFGDPPVGDQSAAPVNQYSQSYSHSSAKLQVQARSPSSRSQMGLLGTENSTDDDSRQNHSINRLHKRSESGKYYVKSAGTSCFVALTAAVFSQTPNDCSKS